MSTPAISSSSRSLFTLAQKIFIVKCYYRGSESPRYVYGCLERRYGRIFAKKDILRSIQEIARYELTMRLHCLLFIFH